MALPIDAAGLTLLYQHCQLCLAENKFYDIVEHAFEKISEAIRVAATRRRRRAGTENDASSTSGRIRSMPSVMIEGGEFLQTAMIVCRALIAVERFDQVWRSRADPENPLLLRLSADCAQASNIVRQLLRFEWPSEHGAYIRDLRCLAVDLFCHRGEYDRAYVQVVLSEFNPSIISIDTVAGDNSHLGHAKSVVGLVFNVFTWSNPIQAELP